MNFLKIKLYAVHKKHISRVYRESKSKRGEKDVLRKCVLGLAMLMSKVDLKQKALLETDVTSRRETSQFNADYFKFTYSITFEIY